MTEAGQLGVLEEDEQHGNPTQSIELRPVRKSRRTGSGHVPSPGVKDVANTFNLSPSRFVGAWWMLIGLPLGAWLVLRGRIGWASMAISPYLLPYWVQMLGLELVRPGAGSVLGAQHLSIWTRMRR